MVQQPRENRFPNVRSRWERQHLIYSSCNTKIEFWAEMKMVWQEQSNQRMRELLRNVKISDMEDTLYNCTWCPLFFPAFKKQFGLTVSIKWHSLPKPSSDEMLPPQPLLKDLFTPPPQPFTLSRHRNRPPSTPPGFCRAVGGPASPEAPICSSATSSALQKHEMSALSSATSTALLHKMSEAAGLGQPLYEMLCSHGGTDGFIYFTYKVCIPGVNSSLEGVVRVLPGPSPTATLEEAQRTAAEQILLRMYHNQLARWCPVSQFKYLYCTVLSVFNF